MPFRASRACFCQGISGENLIQDMSEFRKVPFISDLCDRDTLGHIIGRGFRASVAVEDAGLSKRILSLINGGNENGNR